MLSADQAGQGKAKQLGHGIARYFGIAISGALPTGTILRHARGNIRIGG
jgi:hypothetical protein